MKDQRSLQQVEKEILVVEFMIQQMHQCLEIFHDAKLYDEFQVTLKDIESCKEELKKLIRAKDKIIDLNQGETNDVGIDCRKTFS
jgi:ribosome maturation factor RimP